MIETLLYVVLPKLAAIGAASLALWTLAALAIGWTLDRYHDEFQGYSWKKYSPNWRVCSALLAACVIWLLL